MHDLPGGSAGSGRGSNALRFFNTHQLKVEYTIEYTMYTTFLVLECIGDNNHYDVIDESIGAIILEHRIEFFAIFCI